MIRTAIVVFTLAAGLVAAAPRDASALMQIAPLRHAMSDASRSGSFTVTNLSSNSNRIEFSVTEILGDREVDAADEFIVFPPLITLKSDASQTVRFQFVGDAPAKTRRFYIYASELTPQLVSQAVEGGDANVNLNVLVRMAVLVEIAP